MANEPFDEKLLRAFRWIENWDNFKAYAQLIWTHGLRLFRTAVFAIAMWEVFKVLKK